MANYPNYYSNNNQIPMYQAPMYGIQNPYADRMAQTPQYQQGIQAMGTNQQFPALGKIVDSIDVVKANDIPMDGNMYYFPKADGTEVYAKQWLNNGTTRILTFKPVLDGNPNNSPQPEEKFKIELPDEVTGAFMNRFDELANKISELEQSLTKSLTKSSTKRANSLTKKEEEVD